jgi:hypothetical protein
VATSFNRDRHSTQQTDKVVIVIDDNSTDEQATPTLQIQGVIDIHNTSDDEEATAAHAHAQESVGRLLSSALDYDSTDAEM